MRARNRLANRTLCEVLFRGSARTRGCPARSTPRWPMPRAVRAASPWSAARPASARRRWSSASSRSEARRAACCGARATRCSPPARSGRCTTSPLTAGAVARAARRDPTARRLRRPILTSCGTARPIVVFEDVHWADEATLDLLRFLGRRIARTTALLVLTYRDDELGPRHPLRARAGRPGRVGRRRRLPLAPLSERRVRALVGGARSTRPRSTARPAATPSSSPKRWPAAATASAAHRPRRGAGPRRAPVAVGARRRSRPPPSSGRASSPGC